MARSTNPRSMGVEALQGDVDRGTVIRIVIEASHFTSPRGRTSQRHPLALDPEHPKVAV